MAGAGFWGMDGGEWNNYTAIYKDGRIYTMASDYDADENNFVNGSIEKIANGFVVQLGCQGKHYAKDLKSAMKLIEKALKEQFA